VSKNLLISLALPIAVSIIAGGAAGYFATYEQIHKLKANKGTIGSTIDAQSLRTAILANPEMIEEAFYALQDKRQAEADAVKRVAMADANGPLYSSKLDPVLGADNAPFVLVEFFDYNCGFCKVASKWVKDSLKAHPGKIKVIMKDFPILEGRSKGSRESSEAAWAVRLQGQDVYEKFHFALMEARGGFDSARIDEIAASVGVDVNRMRADMKKNAPAFDALMKENMALARQLGIDGTPAFITGDTFISGANTDLLQTLLDKTLTEDS
jgi:protein-disulfide isomerase